LDEGREIPASFVGPDNSMYCMSHSNGLPLVEQEEKQESSWELVKRDESDWVDVEEYKRWRYTELIGELEEVRKQDIQEYKRLKQLMLARLMKEVRELVQASYATQKRRVLLEAIEDGRHLSRRVINMWDYQRKQLQEAS
jgi:hypothetical protein